MDKSRKIKHDALIGYFEGVNRICEIEGIPKLDDDFLNNRIKIGFIAKKIADEFYGEDFINEY